VDVVGKGFADKRRQPEVARPIVLVHDQRAAGAALAQQDGALLNRLVEFRRRRQRAIAPHRTAARQVVGGEGMRRESHDPAFLCRRADFGRASIYQKRTKCADDVHAFMQSSCSRRAGPPLRVAVAAVCHSFRHRRVPCRHVA
jgi:hypothetical protein